MTVGKVRAPFADAVLEFERRASRYWKIEIVTVARESARSGNHDKLKDAEAARILSRIPSHFEIVALTRSGKGMDSLAVSGLLNQHAIDASPGLAFVIGGAFGLGEAVLSRAHSHLSLSDMTLPYELARLFLAEQLYRAGTILRGEPYHKG